MTTYKSNKYYGVLTSIIPPLNILLIPFLPLFLATSDPKHLMFLNNTLSRIFFFPIALIAMSVFSICNLILSPFAYMYIAVNKQFICCRRKTSSNCTEVIHWIVLGPLYLIAAIISDIQIFMFHIY